MTQEINSKKSHIGRGRRRLAFTAFFMAGSAALGGIAQAEDKTVTIVSWGGTTQDAERTSVWTPIAKELDITIKEDTLSANSDIKARVQAGNVTWDIVDVGSAGCVDFARQGLLEPLDYSVIKTGSTDPNLVQKNWVGWYTFSTIMAWNKDALKGQEPKDWGDFWDTKKFPGPRSLGNDTANNLEFALMADGVAPDKLYPLDVDRAFRKLAQIKPELKVWWQSGAQSVQLVQSGEANLISLWNARAVAAQKGANVGYTFNQGVLDFECLVIPKGAPHRELAYKVINGIISADREAAFAKALPYGPVNPDAYADGRLPADFAKTLPSSPENKNRQALVDPTWWIEHQAAVTERFQEFIQQ
jgi:putative spermidine/putrescine transport system substrate-binding protein